MNYNGKIKTDTKCFEKNKKDINLDFDWSMLPEKVYNKYMNKYKKDAWSIVDEYVGNISVGELHFNVLFRNYSDTDEPEISLSYDCYVANEDTGYGYTLSDDGSNNIPYDYADGTDCNNLKLSYKEFKEESEKLLKEFIVTNDKKKILYSLVEKAKKPLLQW